MLQIKFLGIGEQVNTAMKHFDLVRKESQYPIEIEYINHHQEILQHSIKGIPSVIINGDIKVEGRMPGKNELKALIQAYANQKSKLMKRNTVQKILVPIDDSTTALAALKYAQIYAKQHQAHVEILNVCSFNFDHTNNAIPESIDDLQKQKIGIIQQHISPLFPDGLPDIKSEIGYPIDIIKSYSSNYDLIIMGSTGKHGVVNQILGSISSGVAQHAMCPVLLVPPGNYTSNVQKVLFACQPEKEIDTNALGEMNKLHDVTNLKEVHFLEVYKPGSTQNNRIHDTIASYKKNQPNHITFSIEQLEHKSIIDSINNYVSENNMDMIVMTTVHRNPVKAFFHKSQTKRMVLDIKVPMLVLHQ